MIISNNFNLPIAIYNAVKGSEREIKPNRYSVTELISPPQMVYLRRKHWAELKEDCSQRLWALLGQAVHAILMQHSPTNSLAEEKIEITIEGIVLTGTADLWYDNTIDDYKITSVYSFLLGEKVEWQQQLNCYAYLYRCLGFPVEKLTIHAILRDWQSSKSYERNYPNMAFHSLDISLWTLEQQEQFIKLRIKEHQTIPPRPCTPAEKWTRPSTFAVKRYRRKTALRVLDTMKEATLWIEAASEGSDLYIEQRKGENVRCERFCIVKDYCLQYKMESPA